jgi:hypothetical protein
MEINSDVSPTVRRISTTEKALITKRSKSSPGEGRQSLSSSYIPGELNQEPAEQTEQKADLSPSKTMATKRKSTTEKSMETKRSQSSPGEGRQSLPGMKQAPELHAAPTRRPFSSDGVQNDDDTSSAVPVKKCPSGVVQETAEETEGVPARKLRENLQVKTLVDTVEIGRSAEAVQTKARVQAEYEGLPFPAAAESCSVPTAEEHGKPIREAVWGPFFRETRHEWKQFLNEHSDQWAKIIAQRNRCVGALVVMFIYCGLGGLVFRFTEGAFEAFYKCGVKRVKRDFVESLWLDSHHLPADEWKSQARRKLMELETQLHAAHEAGLTTYSGQRSWSFLNAVLYCLTVVTTIGKTDFV